MNNKFFKISKLINWLFCIYFILFFALVIPFHHHADNKTHEKDCSVCMLAAQQFSSDVNYNITAVFVFIIAVTLVKTAVKIFKKRNIYLRSPPTL
ncbi:MAG: hypothetical protein VB017_07200 [Endomicrobiaceae bacterium]|nr:hypothetical protein [Endomicrobiaceae bacterium]